MRHNFREDNNFTDDMPFGEFIRKKRRLMGYNQTDFAKMLNVHQHTISEWELGKSSPPIDAATDIASKLGGTVMIVNLEEAEYLSD